MNICEKKILIIIPTIGGGGTERVASRLANMLCNDNFKVKVLLLEKESTKRYYLDSRIEVINLCIDYRRGNKLRAIYNFLLNFYYMNTECKKIIEEYTPDIVISFLPKADILTYFSRSNEKFKWIASERNDPTVRNKIEQYVLPLIYKKCEKFVCQSNIIEQYYKNKGVNNTVIIDNPVTIKDFIKDNKGIKEDFLVSVGRLDKQKNYKLLITAYKKAKMEFDALNKIFIYGDGPQKDDLQALINNLQLTNDIILKGRIDNIRDVLVAAKAYVMTSNYEGSPNALLEAMEARKPVICTDFYTGIARELIDNRNGFLIRINNIDDIKNALISMAKADAEWIKEAGNISRNRIKRMDSNIVYKKWLKIINE